MGKTRIGGPCASREKLSLDRDRPPDLKIAPFQAWGVSNRRGNRIIAEKCLILLGRQGVLMMQRYLLWAVVLTRVEMNVWMSMRSKAMTVRVGMNY